MIGVLTQIVLRQVCALKGRKLDGGDSPPPQDPTTKEASSPSRARRRSGAPAPDPAAGQTGGWPEPVARTLVLLFTTLAQRRMPAAPAQGEDA
jgi:hypothetical protein